ncbi:hypothetical protein FV196_04840 [Rothia dentocariosa]|uniref:hypothetical protein n=1 Tax=Rothia dentocariosa TaxID=2047 RepID=UPI001455DB58|nr:hypothetical protein [Rothia dentocariosa]NLR25416.1 hypothetical protein [Rothia dentocariosa]
MVDYALGDRGTLTIVTDNYYEAETLQVFQELHVNREQSWQGKARLVPEPDNPYEANSIAVYVGDHKVGRLNRDDSANYWNAITRVVASGFSPTAQLQLNAIALRADSGPHIKSVGKLFLSSPTLLFPLNHASARAAILPQGPSIKVLDENGHAEYLHSILPPTGEGRVILRLEVQQVKSPDGHMVNSVEVFHEDTHVGRLSSQISEQFIPVIEHAAKHDKLTNVWGTIRGNRLELSLTIQAVRSENIPEQWYKDLPNDVPELLPEAKKYEVPDAFVPAEAENTQGKHILPQKIRGFITSVAGKNGVSEAITAHEVIPEKAAKPVSFDDLPEEHTRLLTLVKIMGITLLIVGLAIAIWRVLLGVLIAIMGGALYSVALYFGRRLLRLAAEEHASQTVTVTPIPARTHVQH